MSETQANIDRVLALAYGFRSTQTTYVMAKLGLADLLASGPASAEDLAARVGASADSLGRVLRLASFIGLVDEAPDGLFALTASGTLLRSDVEGSVSAFAIMLGEQHYTAWGSLLYSVKTAKPAFDHVFGAPFFDYMSAHPEMQATFDAAMSAGADVWFNHLGDAYDFSKARLLVDVGGGNGSLSAIVLKRHPHLEAVIYDQPQVLEAADAYLTGAGVRDRCRLVSGNFFESVPPSGDAYLLSNIVHDWDDERSVQILKNCRNAMNAAGAVLLLEAVFPEHGTPSQASLYDVNMMVLLTGRERTESQYRTLLAAAGLTLRKVVPVSDQDSLIEARVS